MSDSLQNFHDDRPKGYPKTKEEWWLFVGYYKEELRNLIAEYHPCYARWGKPLPITSPGAERVCNEIREAIEQETLEDPLKSFALCIEQKDPNLVRLLNQTWFGIPESLEALNLPGFSVLCDLCSEAYVLEEEHD